MAFGTNIILSGANGWSLASSAFSNPSYLGPPDSSGAPTSTGFEVEPGATLILSFEGAYSGQTVIHEQTLDVTGAAGWFPVQGYAPDGSGASTTASTSGVAYLFAISGVRHRMRMTALSSGTITARASMDSDATVIYGALGAGPAGEVIVGSLQTTVSVTPTITSGSAYAAGNSVGGLLTFSSAFTAKGTGLLQRATIQCKSAQTAQLDLFLFNANPSNTTITDKTAFSLATADVGTLIGVVHIADWTNAGTPSVGQAQGLAYAVRAASGTSLFGALVTRGTPTFSSTSDINAVVQIIQD